MRRDTVNKGTPNGFRVVIVVYLEDHRDARSSFYRQDGTQLLFKKHRHASIFQPLRPHHASTWKHLK